MMKECEVQIIEILDDSFYLGICRAVLEDYYNQKHYFVDKIPVLAVEVINELGDAFDINTEKPDDIESENGCYRFVVL